MVHGPSLDLIRLRSPPFLGGEPVKQGFPELIRFMDIRKLFSPGVLDVENVDNTIA